MRQTLLIPLVLALSLAAAPAFAAEGLCQALDGVVAQAGSTNVGRYVTVTEVASGPATCEGNLKDAVGEAFCAAAVKAAGSLDQPAYAFAMKDCVDAIAHRQAVDVEGKFVDGKRHTWLEHISAKLRAGPFLDLQHKPAAAGDQTVLAVWSH